MKTDYKTLLEGVMADISIPADDISFDIEVDNIEMHYANCIGGTTAEIAFDVDSHVERIEGASTSDWVLMTKSDLDYALTSLADRLENEQDVSEEAMVPMSVVMDVLDQYRILAKDYGDMLKEKPIANVINEIRIRGN